MISGLVAVSIVIGSNVESLASQQVGQPIISQSGIGAAECQDVNQIAGNLVQQHSIKIAFCDKDIGFAGQPICSQECNPIAFDTPIFVASPAM